MMAGAHDWEQELSGTYNALGYYQSKANGQSMLNDLLRDTNQLAGTCTRLEDWTVNDPEIGLQCQETDPYSYTILGLKPGHDVPVIAVHLSLSRGI